MIGDQFLVIASDHCPEEMVIINTKNNQGSTVPLVHIKMMVTVLKDLTVGTEYKTINEPN